MDFELAVLEVGFDEVALVDTGVGLGVVVVEVETGAGELLSARLIGAPTVQASKDEIV